MEASPLWEMMQRHINLSLPTASPPSSCFLTYNQPKGWPCQPASSSLVSELSLENSAERKMGAKLGLVGSACHWLLCHLLLGSLPATLPVPKDASHHWGEREVTEAGHSLVFACFSCFLLPWCRTNLGFVPLLLHFILRF